jgi:hypothetical protein
MVVSRLSEAREAGRIYGLPGPAERADLVRYPSREAAAAAAQELVSRGVAKANLAWVLPGWMASALVVLICTMMRAWPVSVSALVVIAVMLVVTARYLRRLREMRRWSEDEFGRLADLDETDLPAVRHPADPANPRPLSLIAPRLQLFPRWTVIAGALTVVVVLGMASSSVWQVRGFPRERATLVSAPEHKPSTGKWCGKGAGEPRDFTWRSANPPSGLPITFRQSDECNVSVNPGDTATIVRVTDDSGRVHVHVNPVLTYGDAIGLAGVAGLIWFAAVLAVTSARRLWYRRQANRASRRQADGAQTPN